MSATPHTLSLIVITRNEADHLPRLAASLEKLRLPPKLRLETVLVDGGSTDKTPDIARSVGFHHVLVAPGASIPACRNLGATTATGEWLAFVDADCTLAADWAEQAVTLLRAGAEVAGWPALPPPDGTWVQQAWATHWRHKHGHAATSPHGIRHQAFRLITTRNMLLTRNAFDHLHGFNKALLTGEDTDFAFRAEQAGLNVLAHPSLLVTHHREPATLREFFRQQRWHANRNAYPTLLRQGPTLSGLHAPLYTLLFLLCLLAAVAGIAAAILGHPTAAWAATPLLLLLLLPAVTIATRAHQPRQILALTTLYAAYALARSFDLLGLLTHKHQPWHTK